MYALKGVVILMTVAIAVLMTLIVYGMYQKSQDPSFKFFNMGGGDAAAVATTGSTGVLPPVSGAEETATPRVQPFGDITLPLPQGAHIATATVSGGLLIVTVAGGNEPAGQVWVVDLASGQVLGRVKAQP